MKLETCSRRSTYESEASMCSHWHFYRGNEAQSRTTLKTVNFVLLRMSHSLKVPYTSPISYRVLNLAFFLGGEGKRLFQNLSLRRGANSKRGAYLKGALIRAITVMTSVQHWPETAISSCRSPFKPLKPETLWFPLPIGTCGNLDSLSLAARSSSMISEWGALGTQRHH